MDVVRYYLLPIILFVTALFLILLVLVQRGRGGGLAGAFGGMGGQSAFGTKAGDLFTRITIGVAAFWIFLCALSVKLLSFEDTRISSGLGSSAQQTAEPVKAPAPGKKSAGSATGAPAKNASPAPAKQAPASAPAAPANSPAPPASKK